MVTKEKIDYFLLKPIDWLDENSSTWSDWLDYALRHEDNIIDIIDNNRKDLSQALSLINSKWFSFSHFGFRKEVRFKRMLINFLHK